jgi:hypothetical protein
MTDARDEQWNLLYEVDFAAQPSQVLAPDGAYVINGLSCTKANTAGELENTRIVNGTGLIFCPLSGLTRYTTLNTAPRLTVHPSPPSPGDAVASVCDPGDEQPSPGVPGSAPQSPPDCLPPVKVRFGNPEPYTPSPITCPSERRPGDGGPDEPTGAA